MSSVFIKHAVTFPPLPQDGSVEIGPFLEAAQHIPVIFDSLGTAFTPLRSDVNGNIEKIRKQCAKDPVRYQKFRTLCEDEIRAKTHTDSNSACVATLWLKRALEYVVIFLGLLVKDHQEGLRTENMVAMVTKAYEDSLKPYHGWVVQKLFSVICYATPWRKDFLLALADGSGSSEDQVISDAEECLRNLEPNVIALHQMLSDLDLNSTNKV